MNRKVKIGLTGGIGSGKSTVADFLHKKGITVFDADKLAKELMISDERLRRKLIENFGEEVYSGGELNRKYLAEKIFNDEKNIEKINAIVHPVVKEHLSDMMADELKKNDIVAAEAALIFEANMESMFDYVWTVTADEEIRIERTMKRSNLTRDEALRRIANQLPEKEKISKADFVFYNNYSIEKLEENVAFVLTLIQKI